MKIIRHIPHYKKFLLRVEAAHKIVIKRSSSMIASLKNPIRKNSNLDFKPSEITNDGVSIQSSDGQNDGVNELIESSLSDMADLKMSD